MDISLKNKDGIISTLEDKYKSLRDNYEKELEKYSKLREESMSTKIKNNNQNSNIQNEIKKKDQELEELKHKHFVVTQERINELLKEKSDLRDTFEDSIRKLRNAHERDTDEMKKKIKETKEESYNLLENIRQHKMEHEKKIDELQREINSHKESLNNGR